MQLEINNRRKTKKKNQYEEIKQHTLKQPIGLKKKALGKTVTCFEISENENTIYQTYEI